MAAARKKNSGAKVFKINRLSKSDNGNLICESCPAEVQYISAHTRGASNTPVAAYLKLWQDKDHEKDCEYSIKGAVDKLVAESTAVEDFLPILGLQPDGSNLFRLNILVEALDVAEKVSGTNDDRNVFERETTGCKYIHNWQQLASYCRSAAGLVKLRALIEDSSDIRLLTKLIKIQYKKDFLMWKDFYYDQPRYPELFKRLSNGKILHPIALNITIIGEEAKHSKDAKILPWSFQCHSKIIPDNGNNLVFIPWLRLAKEEFSKELSKGDTVLVVGKAWANKVTDLKSIYRHFNISAYNKSQFKKELD